MPSATRVVSRRAGHCTLAADGAIAAHEDYYDMHALVRRVEHAAAR